MGRWIDALKKLENADMGSRQNRQNPREPGFVSFVSSTSEQNTNFSEAPDNGARRYADWTDEARRDLYEERAAIMEFDGWLTRGEAEAAAWGEVLGDRPSVA